jgi:hypothetical protein
METTIPLTRSDLDRGRVTARARGASQLYERTGGTITLIHSDLA